MIADFFSKQMDNLIGEKWYYGTMGDLKNASKLKKNPLMQNRVKINFSSDNKDYLNICRVINSILSI